MRPARGLTLAGGVVAVALAAAACGYTAPDPAGGTGGYYGAAPSTQAQAAPVVAVSSAALGPGTALVDSTGRAIYLFENDGTSTSTCAGTCANVWPPVPASTNASSDPKLGSTTRPDSVAQLTYAGHPLYYYIGDHNPGDSNGQGLNQFGARWYLVQPSGAELGND